MPKPRNRANGEGTIFKRTRNGKTRWYAEIVIGYDGDNKRQVIRSAGDTRKEVAEWLAARQTDRQKGALVKPSGESLAAFMEDWLEKVVSHDVDPSTQLLHHNMYNWYIKDALGGLPLGKISPELIQGMIHNMLKSGLAARTAQLALTTLKKCLEQAVTWGKLALNPAAKVKPPKAPKPKITFLSPDQIAQFIEAAREERLHALLILTVTMGLRRGEGLGLRWSDLDLAEGTITINQQQKKVGEEISFADTKTAAGRRSFDLPQVTLDALRIWRDQQQFEKKNLHDWPHPELVFTTEVGTPIHPRNLRDRALKRTLQRAGCPRVKWHELRHSAATFLLSQGAPIRVVQEILGHSTVRITLDLYGHVLREQKKEAADKIDAFLAGAQEKKRKKAR